MTAIRSIALLAVALSLLLAGCRDARRDAVRSYLETHPPEGFEVVAIPEKLPIARGADGVGQAVVTVKYRLTQPTIEIHDLFTLPRGTGLAQRLTAVRGWALSSLPAGEPIRETITSASAAARAEFPTKRVITPKGTEVESAVFLTLREQPAGWQVEPQLPMATAPGAPDQNPRIPWDDAPEVSAKFDQLEIETTRLEGLRAKYLADRAEAARRSLARLRSLLKTGKIFEGFLTDGTPVRLVISQGADQAGAIVVILTTERSGQASARYRGTLAQQPSGEAIVRAAQVVSLSNPSGESLTDASAHPILTLSARENGLSVQVKVGTAAPVTLALRETGTADLIPDVSPQDPN